MKLGRHCLLLAIVMLVTASASWSASPAGERYSVQLLSAKSSEALQRALASVADFPNARIAKRGDDYALRVGLWDSRAEAEQALKALQPRFRSAYVRTAANQAENSASTTTQRLRSSGPRASPATATGAPSAGTTQANVLSSRSDEQQNVVPNREIPRAAPGLPPTPTEQLSDRSRSASAAGRPASIARPRPLPDPDEEPLWMLLREQRYIELDAELTRLRAVHPGWSPPAKLLSLKEEGEAHTLIARALAGKEWKVVVTLSQQYPQQFDCSRLEFMWGLAEAHYALGNNAQTLAVYERIIPACPNAAERVATLYKASIVLSPENFDHLLQREVRSGTRNADEQTQLDQITYQHRLRPFFEAVKARDFRRARDLIQGFEQMLKSRRDAPNAALVGWVHFETDEVETAAMWFDTALGWDPKLEDARYGLALASFRLNRLNDAEAILAKANADDPRSRALRGDIFLRQAQEAHNSKRYQDSLDRLMQAELTGRSGRDISMLRAWNYYQLGSLAEATPLFVDAYRSQPDKESAEGAILSLSQAQRWEELEALARSLGEPFRDRWRAVMSQRYYDRKLFLAAEAFAPGNLPQLRNIASPSIAVGGMLRDKSGEEGTSKLRVLKAPFVEGTVGIHSTDELRLRIYRVDLDSGNLPANAMIGSFPAVGSYVTGPTTRLRDGVEPHLSWRREGWLSVYAGIGLTPSNAVLGSTPIGNLGFVQQHERGNWRGEIFSQPVRESILSYTGIVDPYTGQNWGRVRRSGASIGGYTAVSERWGASAGLQVMHLAGENVATNNGLTLNFALARNLKLSGFEYFSVGPDLSYETYRRNLSHFTVGHGGYFSPDRLISLGVSGHFLTAEARQYIIKGDASVGVYDKREAASPCFPLGGAALPVNPGCQNGYAAINGSGLFYSAELMAVRRLSDHLQVGGGFILRRNPDYDDKAMILFLRYVFGPRSVVMSSDLPRELFQSLY